MKENKVTACPCGSKQAYELCCGCYISGAKIPTTAEALMRSRYTAYTLADIDYIQKTMRGLAAKDFDPEAAKAWAQKAKWKRLKVLATFPHNTDPHRYYVKFTAYYLWQGRPQQIEEVSEFQRIDGNWYYINSVASF